VGLDTRIAIVGSNGAGKSTLWVHPSIPNGGANDRKQNKTPNWRAKSDIGTGQPQRPTTCVSYVLLMLLACLPTLPHEADTRYSGYFAQHHVDTLIPTMNPVQFLAHKFPGKTEQEYRQHLGNFQISGLKGLQPIGTLSGGQKSRVAFSVLSLQRPHILLLDEVRSAFSHFFGAHKTFF
jgi:ABC transporter